jgi:carnosine N-methyltransferase
MEATDFDEDRQKEKNNFTRITNAFRFYGDHYIGKFNKTLRYVMSMPSDQREKLTKYVTHLEAMKKCVQQNTIVMRLIMENACLTFDEGMDVGDNSSKHLRSQVRPNLNDMDKTASVLRQIVREWTKEGETERHQSYGPILQAVDKYFGSEERKKTKILVPGAGLGRLAFELASRGFSTQGNEFSSFMIFSSYFILNECSSEQHDFYPFVHQINNILDSEVQLTKLSFPDVFPESIPEGVEFSMIVGDFEEVYSTAENKDHFDCVTTCFFMDTAHNILQYLETLRHTLKPGGLWINLGPLLYHFSEISNEESIEPPYDLLKEMIISSGFEFLEEKTDVRCCYTQNQSSMLHSIYKCVYFVCRKVSQDYLKIGDNSFNELRKV